MLGCSGRGGSGGEAAGTAGSSSSARATTRQAALASTGTGIVRAVALPLDLRLLDSQAALVARRPCLHARHTPEDSGAPQPSRARCGARGSHRCGWSGLPGARRPSRSAWRGQTLAWSDGEQTRSGTPQTSGPPAARPPSRPQPPPDPAPAPFRPHPQPRPRPFRLPPRPDHPNRESPLPAPLQPLPSPAPGPALRPSSLPSTFLGNFPASVAHTLSARLQPRVQGLTPSK